MGVCKKDQSRSAFLLDHLMYAEMLLWISLSNDAQETCSLPHLSDQFSAVLSSECRSPLRDCSSAYKPIRYTVKIT